MLPIPPYWKRFAQGCPQSFVMKDHQSRLGAQPILGCVVPGMKRQRDSHIAKKRVAGIGEFDRFGISEPLVCLRTSASFIGFIGIVLGAGRS